MPVLSIIACRMLEDELAHILSADRTIRELFLVDSRECLSFSLKLRSQHRSHILLGLDEIVMQERVRQKDKKKGGQKSRKNGRSSWTCGILPDRMKHSTGVTDLVVIVSFLRIGLHSDLDLLKGAVCDNVRRLSTFSDGILIFYGKCGNSLIELERELPDLSCPLYFLADGRGERVDDCISVALGGNENYSEVLAKNQNVAIFLTPMWASNWKTMGEEDAALGKRRDLMAWLSGSGMTRVAKIDTGLHYEPGFDERVNAFASHFGLEKIDLPGGHTLAMNCYQNAKSSLLAGSLSVPEQNQHGQICSIVAESGLMKSAIALFALCRRACRMILGN